MMFKTQIKRGERVLVRRGGRIREGAVVDTHRDCAQIKFRFLCFWWHEWLPVKSKDCEILLKTPEN